MAKWLRTDKLTQKQFRDIETNETDLGSKRVGKQRETENGHKPETVKGRQKRTKTEGTDGKTKTEG